IKMPRHLKTIIKLQRLLAYLLCLFFMPCALLYNEAWAEIPLKETGNAATTDDPLRQRIASLQKELASLPTGQKQKAFELASLLRKLLSSVGNDQNELARINYLLGEAYLKAGYSPEATTYLRLTAKQFPDSPWGQQALLTLMKNAELSGGEKDGHDFYNELIRQFPNTLVGKTAWITLANKAVDAGNINEVAIEMARLEDAYPDIGLSVPKFLDLKAKVLAAKGKEAEAREEWMRYLNLVQSPDEAANALFNIGNSYRREQKFQEAVIYYLLLNDRYPDSLDALLAKGRIIEIENGPRAMDILLNAWPKLARLHLEKTAVKERIFSEIIQRVPNLPIARDSMIDYMSLKFEHGDYNNILGMIGESTKLKGYETDSAFVKNVSEMAIKAQDALLGGADIKKISEALSICRKFLAENNRRGPFWPLMSAITQKIWNRLIDMRMAQGDFPGVIDDAKAFAGILPDGDETNHAKEMGRSALLSLDKALIDGKRPLTLLNYHFSTINGVDWLSSPEHLFYVGLAWDRIDCPDAAMRAFYQAWKAGPSNGLELLLVWAEIAIRSKDMESANAISNIIEARYSKTQGQNPKILWLRAAIARSERNWAGVVQTAQKAMGSEMPTDLKKKMKAMLFEANLHLGQWAEASSIWKDMKENLTDREKVSFLTEWGDMAFKQRRYTQAQEIYNQLKALEPEEPFCSFRLSLAEYYAGMIDKALKDMDAVSKGPQGLLADAAKAIMEVENFFSGPDGEFLAKQAVIKKTTTSLNNKKKT
ncbi:MAG: tetratricopeptide repeat protein, partial [Dissulfurimicrobium sp.]|uniref:tetratricopeptide repeat protein n=1 Tax=Dissulfurimicrobium sp. TaxID=2022436 RepID=UPI00404A41C7